MDHLGSTRRGGARSSVVAGSVWESRMKHDEVRGGIKVFNGEETSVSEEGNGNGNGNGINKLRRGVVNGGTGKRKKWKSESFDGFERNPIQIARGKVEENGKEVRSPVQGRRLSLRSEGNNKDTLEKSPIGVRKTRSESLKEEPNSAPLRKAKSDSVSVSAPVQSGKDDDDDESGNGVGLVKVKSEPNEVLDESIDGSVEEIEKNPVENGKSGSDEGCKELDVCQEKVISGNVEVVKSTPKCDDDDDNKDENEDGEGEGECEEVNEEIEVEVEVEKKSLDIQEIKKPEPKPINKVVNNGEKVVSEVKKVHFERRQVKRLHQVYQKQPEPISLNVKKQPPVIKRATVHSSFAKGSSKSSSCESLIYPFFLLRFYCFLKCVCWGCFL